MPTLHQTPAGPLTTQITCPCCLINRLNWKPGLSLRHALGIETIQSPAANRAYCLHQSRRPCQQPAQPGAVGHVGVPSYGARHRRIGAEYGAIVQTEAAKAIEHHPAPLAIRVRWGSACIRRLCFPLESSPDPPATNRARLPSFLNRITAHPPDAGSGPVGAGIADRSDSLVPRPAPLG